MRFIILFALIICGQSSYGQNSKSVIPDRILLEWNTLTMGDGTWITDNSAFKNENEPFDEYGVTWTWGLGKSSINGRLFGLKDGKEVATFWEFRMYYHPQQKKLRYQQYGANGTIGIAEMDFVGETKTEDVVVFYYLDGTSAQVKHETERKHNVQYSQSFKRNSDSDSWEKDRYYIWKRNKS